RRQSPIIVVTGQYNTFKSAVATNFLLRGLLEGKNGLLLSLRESVAPDIKTTPVFCEGWPDVGAADQRESNADLLDKLPDAPLKSGENTKIMRTSFLCTSNAKERRCELSVLSFRPGYILAEEFIEAVLMEIEQLTRSTDNPAEETLRVVLDDASEIPSRFPLLAQSRTAGKMFLPALVDVIRGKGPIPILITASGEPLDPVLSLVADAILETSRISIYGRDTVILRVSSSDTEALEEAPTPIELTLSSPDSSQGGKACASLVADSSRLEDLVKIETGAPYRAKLGISLYVESEAQIEYAKRLRSCADALLGQKVTIEYFTPETAEPLYEARELWRDAPLHDTKVIMFDEFCKEEAKTGLVDLKRYLRGAETANAVESNATGGKSHWNPYHEDLGKAHYGLPFYSNVLLLAWNEETDQGRAFANRRALQDSKEDMWKKLMDLAVGKDLIFDFDRRASETYVCLFLELLDLPMKSCADDPTAPSLEAWLTKPCDLTEQQMKDREQRLSNFSHLLHASERNKKKRGVQCTEAAKHECDKTRKRTLNEPPLNRTVRVGAAGAYADVWCHWYTTLRDMLKQNDNLAPHIRVAALPSGGFKGDWYLGIAAGSVSVKTGWQVVSQLCSPARDGIKLYNGVGLPVCKASYDKKISGIIPAWPRARVHQDGSSCAGSPRPTLEHLGAIWDGAQRRSDFPEYIHLHRLFRETFAEIIRPEAPRNEEEIRLLLERMRVRAHHAAKALSAKKS
ncbi:MAG: hypothetical protein HQ592_08720, partial [Planctomycetes bacterium]|nr:hypothetical protein [Planctomycetota bacterium]